MTQSVYLDYAAATPLDERVFVAMRPYFETKFYNPSSSYTAAVSVRGDYEAARQSIAKVLGARPSEVIMTAGATESINLAVRGVMGQYFGHVVTTGIEHPAVLETVRSYEYTLVRTDIRGKIDLSNLKYAIKDETSLITIGYANNELGTIQPLQKISELVQDVRADRLRRKITQPLFLHTDASQAAGLLGLSLSRLGVDMMTLNAAKCYGPKQTGLLWAQSHIKLDPIVTGGGQERNLRSGTENVTGVIGFAQALLLAESERKTESYRLSLLRDELERCLVEAIPDLLVNGDLKKRLANHLHVSLAGLDGERALFALDERGIQVATGSACAANKVHDRVCLRQ